MNDIVRKENSEASIKRLAAQRALYSSAKRFLAAQFIISVPVAILIAFAALALDKEWFGLPKIDMAWLVGVSGFCFVMIEVFLNPLMSSRKEKAAKIQQCFDCDVLDLPMCEITYGKPIDPEITEVWAKKCLEGGTPTEEFRNWYRVEVAELPMEVARIICQRANCWWDEELRRRYNQIIGLTGMALVIVIVAIVLALDCTAKIIFGLVVPLLLPFISVALKVAQDNREAILRLTTMKEAINDVWQKILDETISKGELMSFANAIQGGIFSNRKNNPLVFDWLHKRLKSRHEDATSRSTQSYVEEFKARRGV